MKVAAHTIGTKVSECLQPKFVIGEKTHYNDFAHKFFQLSTYVFSTPKHEDIHMPCFATLREAQKPMSLQQTEERIKIVKLLSKI